MGADAIDTVAVRLTADATDLLDQADAAVERVADKAEEAGQAFADAFGDVADAAAEQGSEAGKRFAESFNAQAAGLAGDLVRQMSEDLGQSYMQGAETVAQKGIFPEFNVDQLLSFAQALDDAGISMDDLNGQARLTSEQIDAFTGVLDSATQSVTKSTSAFDSQLGVPSAEHFKALSTEIADFAEAFDVSLEEAARSLAGTAHAAGATEADLLAVADAMGNTQDLSDRAKDAIDAINQSLDYLGKRASPQARKEIQNFIENLGDLEAITTDEVEQLEKLATGTGDFAAKFTLADDQVRKVVEAFRDMGKEIPNALQRDKIRQYVRELIQMKDEFSDVEKEANNFTDQIIKQTRATKEGRNAFTELFGEIRIGGLSLGQFAGAAAKGGAALLGLKVIIGATLDLIKESIGIAIDYAEANRDLSLAVRVNSVAGMENTRTFREWQATAQQVAETARTTTAVGIQTVTIALRELGAGTQLSDDQINSLLVSGGKFSDLYGLKLPDQINQLTRFITSGYAESLAGLGLQLGQQAQQQKAFELGLGTNLQALDENQQALVRYSLLMDELDKRTEGAGERTATFTDRMADLEKRSEDAKTTLGTLFLPFLEFVKKVEVNITEGFTGLVGIIATGIVGIVGGILGTLKGIATTVIKVINDIKEGTIPSIEDIGETFVTATEMAISENLESGLAKLYGGLDELSDSANNATTALEGTSGAAGELAEQAGKFAEEAQKFAEGLEKIDRKLGDTLADLQTQFIDRRAQSYTNLLRDLRDLDRKSAIDRLEAIRDYQIDEIRLREDHAKDIKQLESRYVLDLEDAVRDRDARQVLSLQRRFNLEKQQREEDFNLRQKRLHEDFQLELLQIEEQRRIRRQERLLAYQEELLDLNHQEEVRRQQALSNAERQRRELLEQIKNRLLDLQMEADASVAIEQGKLDKLEAALIETYGTDGPWVAWHDAAVDVSANSATAVAQNEQKLVDSLAQTEGALRAHYLYVAQIRNQTAALAGQALSVGAAGGGGGGGGTVLFRQRGGSSIVTSPTTFVAGERPERVDITPLSGATGQPTAGFRGGARGDKMQIELKVDASERLVVEVADQTMSEIADVYVTLNQRSYQGGRGA